MAVLALIPISLDDAETEPTIKQVRNNVNGYLKSSPRRGRWFTPEHTAGLVI